MVREQETVKLSVGGKGDQEGLALGKTIHQVLGRADRRKAQVGRMSAECHVSQQGLLGKADLCQFRHCVCRSADT